MLIQRREFLRLAGAASGALLVGAIGADSLLEIPDEVVDRLRKGPGVESWKSTVCGQCTGGCGLRVRLVDGVPVYLKGNRLHPVSRGGMCPLGHGAIEWLFNPDRIKSPMRRIGPVGSGKWEPVPWPQAISLVAERLEEIRDAGQQHRVAFLGGSERGLMREVITHFMDAYGSPNYFHIPSRESETLPFLLATGRPSIPAYDIENARLVVSFGSDFLGAGLSPVYYTKMYGRVRGAGGLRTRFVQVEPRLSLTGENADHWIPIRPGTYGALALGLAHVLLRENLYDSEFVGRWTFGFDAWVDRSGGSHAGFRDLVLEEYYPDHVSEITGVPSQEIINLGRELGLMRPSLVLPGDGVAENTNGVYSGLAVLSLNALLGNFGKAGGLSFPEPSPVSRSGAVSGDEPAASGRRGTPLRTTSPADDRPPLADSTDAFCRNLAAGQPYPVDLLFLFGGNPVFNLPGHHDLVAGLGRVPLVVSFDSFLTETSEFADLILPNHTFLERWEEVSDGPSVPFAHVSLQQPVVEPIHETRHTGDVLMNLAAEVGGKVATAFSFDSYRDALRHRLRGVYQSGKGAVSSTRVTSSWLEYLRERGWHIGEHTSFESFWSELAEHGAWWNPEPNDADPASIFKTPSGKYELYSQLLQQNLVGREAGSDLSDFEDTDFLPHHEPPPEFDDGMTLSLIPFQTLSMRDGSGANQPLVSELFGLETRQYGRSWAEINPETASRLGIADGEWVWVESVIGSIQLPARVTPGIVPDCVAIPIGLGHTSYGRYARGRGVNPALITKSLSDTVSGHRTLNGTTVRISKAT